MGRRRITRKALKEDSVEVEMLGNEMNSREEDAVKTRTRSCKAPNEVEVVPQKRGRRKKGVPTDETNASSSLESGTSIQIYTDSCPLSNEEQQVSKKQSKRTRNKIPIEEVIDNAEPYINDLGVISSVESEIDLAQRTRSKRNRKLSDEEKAKSSRTRNTRGRKKKKDGADKEVIEKIDHVKGESECDEKKSLVNHEVEQNYDKKAPMDESLNRETIRKTGRQRKKQTIEKNVVLPETEESSDVKLDSDKKINQAMVKPGSPSVLIERDQSVLRKKSIGLIEMQSPSRLTRSSRLLRLSTDGIPNSEITFSVSSSSTPAYFLNRKAVLNVTFTTESPALKSRRVSADGSSITDAVKKSVPSVKFSCLEPVIEPKTPCNKTQMTPHPVKKINCGGATFSAKRMPNFKKIHEKNFEKMESLVQYKARKIERAKLFSPTILKAVPKKGLNNTIGVYNSKKSCIPVFQKRTLNKSLEKENRNSSLYKCPINVSTIREKQADVIKGVRMNKRFLLQLQNRKIKETFK